MSSIKVKQRIGYLSANPYFYDYLTGWEFLQFIAGLFEIPSELQKQRIPMLFYLVGLSQSAARKSRCDSILKGCFNGLGWNKP